MLSKAQLIWCTTICVVMDLVAGFHPHEFFAVAEHGPMGWFFIAIFVGFNLFVLWVWYNIILNSIR